MTQKDLNRMMGHPHAALDPYTSEELEKKADKVTTATNGDIATLDSNGNLVDSGKKITDFVPFREGSNFIYINDPQGNPNIAAYTQNAIQNTIALRGANGILRVGTPSNDADATPKKYVDEKFYTFELNETTYDFNEGTLTEEASAALLAAITAKKPIFYIGLCAGTTNIFDPSLNDPICCFVNYNPVPNIDEKYYINIPDNIMLSEQQYGATFDPATREFYPNGV